MSTLVKKQTITKEIKVKASKAKTETPKTETPKTEIIKKVPVLHAANNEAKKDFTISTYWNKIQKSLDSDDNVRNAFETLKQNDNNKGINRKLSTLLDIPFTVLTNHFLTVYNDGKKFSVKEDKISWYTFSLFLSWLTKLDNENFNSILNFGLKHKPKTEELTPISQS